MSKIWRMRENIQKRMKINDFRCPGGVPEAPWGLLGASWNLLEASWGLLWASWGVLAASWTRRWRPRGTKTSHYRPTGGPRRPQDASWVRSDHRPFDEGGSREGWWSHFGRPGSPGEGGRGVGKQVEEGSWVGLTRRGPMARRIFWFFFGSFRPRECFQTIP